MLVIFEVSDKLRTPNDFDSVVRAEIPSQTEEPNLYEAVLHHMIHGPCGLHNPHSPCITDGKYKKNFPKKFVTHTSRGNDSNPLYRRREDRQVVISDNDQRMVDNSWVVPYNPCLLLKYDCHINVEVCGGIKCVKYIYKYIHKRPDRVSLELRNGKNHDEIQQYVDGRTFKEAAQMRGLLNHEDYLRQCLQEACSTRMPSSLRKLFVLIWVFCQPTGVRELWDDFNTYMSEDYGRSSSASTFFITNKLLLEIGRLLHHYKKTFISLMVLGGLVKHFCILAKLRKEGKIIIAVSTSGIVAKLLPGGRTAHSRLQITFTSTETSFCNIKKQTDLAELIRRAATVLWDDAPMASRCAFETVNKIFKDIMENHLPFGGKIMQNMRSAEDSEFSQFLLRIGDGLQHATNGDFIKLPESMIIQWEGEESINKLTDFVFTEMIHHVNDANYMVGRAIITPKNCDVDKINEMRILKFPGEQKVYTSWDSVEDDDNNLFQEEFLNSLTSSGLPPHRISLKVGCPIMLLRNVAPELGLCNRTRLICCTLGRNFIDADIITGPHKGTDIFFIECPLKVKKIMDYHLSSHVDSFP
ncbi:uncharacterized protein [Henckelia pumila]|uniref:uncharacterized protein n=1 Tax=Henckelia pumila TaxID=405737 RepID=UPI003C6E03ED